MSIKRIDVGARMSQVVVHNGTVYTAGQVAIGAPGGSIADQTADILSRIDALLDKAGSDKSKLISATIWVQWVSDPPGSALPPVDFNRISCDPLSGSGSTRLTSGSQCRGRSRPRAAGSRTPTRPA